MDELFVPFKAKMGRPLKYRPSALLKKFEEYLEERAANPITEVDSEEGNSGINRISKTTTKKHPCPISIRDFCIFLGTSYDWWKALGEDFFPVKSYIRTYIENFQLKGASIGAFNANIVSRLLGLVDKQQITHDGEQIIVLSQEEKDKLEHIGEVER